VQVTAYGAAVSVCNSVGWEANRRRREAYVTCYDTAGAAVDRLFTLQYLR